VFNVITEPDGFCMTLNIQVMISNFLPYS